MSVNGPTGAEVAQALRDAFAAIEASATRLPDPVCGCGAWQAVQYHGEQGPGLYCVNGHWLPGQEMP